MTLSAEAAGTFTISCSLLKVPPAPATTWLETQVMVVVTTLQVQPVPAEEESV